MKVKNLAIGLCMVGSVYTSAATAEVIQDCVLTGEVVSVSQVQDTMRVKFYDLEHGDLANCTMKRRAKRGRVAADMTTSGLEIPRGSTVTYAFRQTRSESKWQLLEVQRPVLLSSKL